MVEDIVSEKQFRSDVGSKQNAKRPGQHKLEGKIRDRNGIKI
jgi:hypothetical protein